MSPPRFQSRDYHAPVAIISPAVASSPPAMSSSSLVSVPSKATTVESYHVSSSQEEAMLGQWETLGSVDEPTGNDRPVQGSANQPQQQKLQQLPQQLLQLQQPPLPERQRSYFQTLPVHSRVGFPEIHSSLSTRFSLSDNADDETVLNFLSIF
jgi:hypothetical protein